MKVFAKIRGHMRRLKPELFTALCSRFPDNFDPKEPYCWDIEGDVESEQIQDVLAWFKSVGVEQSRLSPRDQPNFELRLDRRYTEDDLLPFDWLAFHPEEFSLGDQFGVEATEISRKFRFGRLASCGGAAVSGEFRQIIEDANLCGCQFVQIPLVTHSGKPAKTRLELWHLSGRQNLPPVLAPPCRFRDQVGVEHSTFSPGCSPFDGLFIMPELYFSKDAVTHLKSDDCVNTVEAFNQPPKHSLILSQRFRRLLLDRGVPGEWYPVHLI